MKEKAVVLLSGGLDSCVSLAYAVADGWDCSALSVLYGGRHEEPESLAAQSVARKYAVPRYVVTVGLANMLPKEASALLRDDEGMPRGRTMVDIEEDKGIPHTYVPSRNAIMLSLAASLACSIKASHIYVGCNVLDYSGYPDCREPFLDAMEQALNLGIQGVGCFFDVRAPLLYMTKEEIVNLGRRLHAPLETTWSCYNPITSQGGFEPCHACDSCVIRESALKP